MEMTGVFRNVLLQKGLASPEDVHNQAASGGVSIKAGNLVSRQLVAFILPPQAGLASAVASASDEVGEDKGMVKEEAGFNKSP